MHQQALAAGNQCHIFKVKGTVAFCRYRDVIAVLFPDLRQGVLINMNVPPGQNAAVARILAAGAHQGQLYRPVQMSGVSHRGIDSQLKAVGSQKLHLGIGADGSQHAEFTEAALGATHLHHLIGAPGAPLLGEVAVERNSLLTKQRLGRLLRQVHMVI